LQVQQIIERHVAAASAKSAAFSAGTVPCSTTAAQRVVAVVGAPYVSNEAHAAHRFDLLDSTFASEVLAPVSNLAVSPAPHSAAQAITPQLPMLDTTYDLWDLRDQLAAPAPDCSVACNNEAEKPRTTPKLSASEAAADWWDSFDVSDLSGIGQRISSKPVGATVPFVSSTEVVDELEDFLNSLAATPNTN
jgi:hypothetical protein